MIKTYYAGQELDAPCGRCKSETRHCILSITDKIPERLICKSCKSVHKFRVEKLKKQSPAPRPISATRDNHTTKSTCLSRFQELIIADKVEVNTIPNYNITQQWDEGVWIKHPNFGLGRVQKRLGRKIDVLFRDGIKILVSA
jgi:hypothetical protein